MTGSRSSLARRLAAATAAACLSIAAPSAAPQPAAAPAATLARIGALLESGDLPAAKAAADAALAERPGDPALHNLAGAVAAQRGDFAAAERHFTEAIRLAPRAAPPYENLGRLYLERAGRDPAAQPKALATYRRLLAVQPSNVEGLYQAAYLLVLDGQYAEAAALLERLPAELFSRPHVLAVRAAAGAGTGDLEKARILSKDLARHPDLTAADVAAVMPALERAKAPAVLREMLQALDTRGLATAAHRQRLAALLSQEGRFADARAVLERAAAAGVTVPLLTDLARAAYKGGDPKGALGYLAHARSLEPADANVHFLFGMMCVELELGREAYDALKRAVELEPDNALVNYAMGAVATHRHDPSEAIPYFEKYVALVPDDPRGSFALGAARFYSNQLEAARRDLERVAALPQTAAGARYFLGKIARQLGDLETARREIERALAANPRHADALAELGLIQTREGRYAEAEASLAKALALDPDHYDATMHLAALYGRTRDPRRDAQNARLAELLQQREVRAQEFLRIIEVVP